MQVNQSLLSYCTNIHSGESWSEHFSAIKENFPAIKNRVSPEEAMGLGLRLSNTASLELSEKKNSAAFKEWMRKENAYVFTLNGFPYGNFHHGRIKENVHRPDWTTKERVDYTLRLCNLLAELLPEGTEGGISTSPLGYRHWYIHSADEKNQSITDSTQNILRVIERLVGIKNETSKTIHLDVEPEPDGLLETGREFIDWFEQYLLPLGTKMLKQKFGTEPGEAAAILKDHLRLCYDVCHFAIGYEDHSNVIQQLNAKGIRIGKIQISAALKAGLPANSTRENIQKAFSVFNESTYLHQVVARTHNNSLVRYRDLPLALKDIHNKEVSEWRSHFHVPVFLESFGCLQSTQNEIVNLLEIHNSNPVTTHLEVETYTWEVLPGSLKMPIQESIVRELQWVKHHLNLSKAV